MGVWEGGGLDVQGVCVGIWGMVCGVWGCGQGVWMGMSGQGVHPSRQPLKWVLRILLECIIVLRNNSDLKDNSKRKFSLKLIELSTVSILFPLENVQQECIPVGCMSPTAVVTIRCMVGEGGGFYVRGLCPGGLCVRDLHPLPPVKTLPSRTLFAIFVNYEKTRIVQYLSTDCAASGMTQ